MSVRHLLLFALLAAGLAFGVAYLRPVLLPATAPPGYASLPDAPQFRRLLVTGEGVSPGQATLAGLGQQDEHPRAALHDDALCQALFGATRPLGALPVAYFTDVRCPHCRRLERRLLPLLDGAPGKTTLVIHDWPIFGASSQTAARAIIAAEAQDKAGALRERLNRAALLIDEVYIEEVARGSGLDAARLIAEMNSADVSARLAQTDALARQFGFIGTPGLVIGRTVVDGVLSDRALEALIASERSLPALCE